MIYSPADIVLTRYFPYEDKQKTKPEPKPRPVLVVSSKQYHLRYDSCICLMITTTPRINGDVEIDNLIHAGLHKQSRIRFKIYTIDMMLIEKRLGSLTDDAAMQAVQSNMALYFAKFE